jgi:hypothetical protein
MKKSEYCKKCYSEKTLREVSKGKITNPVMVELPKRFFNLNIKKQVFFNSNCLQKEFNIIVLNIIYQDNILLANIINKDSLRVWFKPKAVNTNRFNLNYFEI